MDEPACLEKAREYGESVKEVAWDGVEAGAGQKSKGSNIKSKSPLLAKGARQGHPSVAKKPYKGPFVFNPAP